MSRTHQGSTDGPIAIVAAKFNREVVDRLVEGALNCLREQGVADDAIHLSWVPGSFEIPLVAKRLAQTGKYAAVIALGAVIRGDTDHYDYVCQAVTHGVLHAGLDTGVPILFGVLTCDTEEQALERAGGKEGNKGYDCALVALDMAKLLASLPK